MTSHVQSSVCPKVKTGFDLLDENAQGRVLDGRGYKGGSKVFGGEGGNGESQYSGYTMLDNRRGVEE